MLIRFLILMVMLSLLGCDSEITSRPLPPRPITVTKLEEQTPSDQMRLTGSAKPWREENLAFEVAGRLKSVLDSNVEVRLIPQNSEGTTRGAGQIVAEIDGARYDAEVESARAQIASAQAELQALQIEMREIIPQQIRGAEKEVAALRVTIEEYLPSERKKARAQLALAQSEYRRAQDLYRKNAGTEQAFEQARNRLQSNQSALEQVRADIAKQQRRWEASLANLAQARASLPMKKSRLQAAQAKIKMLQAQLQIALRNRRDCCLRAPFSGVISQRMVTKGAVVKASQAIVRLTMMDPIMVEFSVAPQIARKLQEGDPVKVYPSEFGGLAIPGWIDKKSVAADPQTRTYSIICVVRNRMVTPRGGDYRKIKNALKREDIALVWVDDPSLPESTSMVWEKSLVKDAQGYFVWVIAGFKMGGKMQFREGKVKKVRVKLLPKFRSFVKREFRGVEAPGLSPKMITLRGDYSKFEKDTTVSYMPTDWVIRPGDLLQISLVLDTYPRGFYVPVDTVFKDSQGAYIFIHDKGVARRIYVKMHEIFRDLQRITAPGALHGKQLIVLGAHYLRDKDRVEVRRP